MMGSAIKEQMVIYKTQGMSKCKSMAGINDVIYSTAP